MRREDFPDSILVVEDEASVRSSLRRLLKTRGIEAIVVATAGDALARINRQEIRPDLLICDYNLRGSANGLDTVYALRAALAREIPAIVMTGDIRSEVAGLGCRTWHFCTDQAVLGGRIAAADYTDLQGIESRQSRQPSG